VAAYTHLALLRAAFVGTRHRPPELHIGSGRIEPLGRPKDSSSRQITYFALGASASTIQCDVVCDGSALTSMRDCGTQNVIESP